MSNNLFEINKEKDLMDIFNGYPDKLIVIYFTAKWCGPCRQIKPKYSDLSQRHITSIFCIIDVDQYKDQNYKFTNGVSDVPTFDFYYEGSKLNRITGADIQALTNYVKVMEQQVIMRMNVKNGGHTQMMGMNPMMGQMNPMMAQMNPGMNPMMGQMNPGMNPMMNPMMGQMNPMMNPMMAQMNPGMNPTMGQMNPAMNPNQMGRLPQQYPGQQPMVGLPPAQPPVQQPTQPAQPPVQPTQPPASQPSAAQPSTQPSIQPQPQQQFKIIGQLPDNKYVIQLPDGSMAIAQ